MNDYRPAEERSEMSHLTTRRRDSCLAIVFALLNCTLCTVYALFMKLSSIEGIATSVNFGLFGGVFWLALFSSDFDSTRQFVEATFEWCRSLVNGAIFCGLYNFLYLLSLQYINLGDCVAINYFSAFANSLLLEMLHLRMRPHLLTLLAGLCGISGMLCICRPEALFSGGLGLSSHYLVGSGLSFASGFFGALYYVSLQKMKEIPASFHSIGYSAGAAFVALPVFVYRGGVVNSCGWVARLFSICGAIAYSLASYFGVLGSQLSNPSASFVIKLFSIISGYILQIVFLPEPLNWYSVAGGALIAGGIVIQSFMLLNTNKN